ncbi:MAG: hypothetical protein JO217_08215, partial [Acidobacteriaceae bacterium]|nr:hypothetical protein [Acidobacteriaceae bacterium]
VPDVEPSEFGTVAHEYVHAVLHREGWKLPLWLGEGLAEYYSNKGDVAAGRYQTLQQSDWLDLADLLCWDTTSAGNERDVARVFYAESAALVQMLADSARYRSQFAQLLRRSRGGNPNLESITGLNLREIMADLHAWVGARQASSPITLPPAPVMRIETSSLSKADAALLLTELKNAGTESRMAVTQASADKKYMQAVAAFNDGDFEGAFESMRTLPSIREDQKFNYWIVAAFGLFASGDRQNATAAAEHARQYAAKPEEEAEASQLASMLASRADLRISHGTDGRNCISTSRRKEPE